MYINNTIFCNKAHEYIIQWGATFVRINLILMKYREVLFHTKENETEIKYLYFNEKRPNAQLKKL